MENKLIWWKKMLHEYFLFAFLQYGLIALCATKFSMVFSYKVDSDIVTFIFVMVLFGLLMDIGLIVRGFRPNLKIMSALLIAIGAVLQVVYFLKHSSSVLAYKSVMLFLIATAIMSILAITLFLMFDKDAMAALREKSKKKGSIYYIAAITIFTYVSTMLLYRYYDSQVNTLVTSGSVNRADGLSAAQVIELADAKIFQADLLLSVFLVVISAAFIWPYKKWVLGSDSKTVEIK